MKAETVEMLRAIAAQFEADDPLADALLTEVGELYEKLAEVKERAEADPKVVNERLVLDVRSQYLRALKAFELQQTHKHNAHSSRRPNRRGRPALASV